MKMDLEPFAAQIDWHFPHMLSPEDWRALTIPFMQTLGQKVVASGPVVIGHIKCFAAFPQGGFLRASVISSDRPVDFSLEGDLGQVDHLSFTLNMLVYGLPAEHSVAISRDLAEQLARERGGDIRFKYTVENVHPSHHHHDHRESHD